MLQQGILLHFSLFCGEKNTATDWPIGFQIFLNAVQYIADPSSYVLIFYNIFTNMDLLSQLADTGFQATRLEKTESMNMSTEVFKRDENVTSLRK